VLTGRNSLALWASLQKGDGRSTRELLDLIYRIDQAGAFVQVARGSAMRHDHFAGALAGHHACGHRRLKEN
jgi:hypothetical protein